MLRFASLSTIGILVISGLTLHATQDSPNEKDKKALQGKWEVVSAVEAGKEVKSPKRVANFDGGKLTFDPKTKDFSEFSFTLDANKSPKAIDLKSKGDAVVGIYEMKGDELKLCLFAGEPTAKNRPKEFSATERTILMVLKRAK